MLIALIVLIAICGLLGYLLYRASKRLLQFDDLFQGILPVLEKYGKDLTRMSSADIDGILTDHPEVGAFHKRNMLAKREIELLIENTAGSVPPRRQKAQMLPKPDVE